MTLQWATLVQTLTLCLKLMRLPAIQFQKQRMTMPHKQRQMAQFTANRMAHLSRLQTV